MGKVSIVTRPGGLGRGVGWARELMRLVAAVDTISYPSLQDRSTDMDLLCHAPVNYKVQIGVDALSLLGVSLGQRKNFPLP